VILRILEMDLVVVEDEDSLPMVAESANGRESPRAPRVANSVVDEQTPVVQVAVVEDIGIGRWT
jgi:hypothetical protein